MAFSCFRYVPTCRWLFGCRRYRRAAVSDAGAAAHSRLNNSSAGDEDEDEIRTAGIDDDTIGYRGDGAAQRQAGGDEAEDLADLPGGAASLTMTSRGVRLAPGGARRRQTAIVGSSANEITPGRSSSAAARRQHHDETAGASLRSAIQPPTSVPQVEPIM